MASTVKELKVLTLEDSVKVIRLLESGKISWILAEQFGVGRTRIPQTLKRKAELLSDYKNNANLDSEIQRRATGNEDINELTWRWFQDASARSALLFVPNIQKKAKMFGESLKDLVFMTSNDWSDSFFYGDITLCSKL